MPRSSSSANPNPMPQAPVFQASGLQHAIQQLKQQYPDSSLVAEFLTYAANEYAVRVLVKVGDRILSTGMAAASDLEQAEDRARMRAIAALGIEALNHLSPPPAKSSSLAHPHQITETPISTPPRPTPQSPSRRFNHPHHPTHAAPLPRLLTLRRQPHPSPRHRTAIKRLRPQQTTILRSIVFHL